MHTVGYAAMQKRKIFVPNPGAFSFEEKSKGNVVLISSAPSDAELLKTSNKTIARIANPRSPFAIEISGKNDYQKMIDTIKCTNICSENYSRKDKENQCQPTK